MSSKLDRVGPGALLYGQASLLAVALVSGGPLLSVDGSSAQAALISRGGWLLLSGLALVVIRNSGPIHAMHQGGARWTLRLSMFGLVGSQLLSSVIGGTVPPLTAAIPMLLVVVALTRSPMPLAHAVRAGLHSSLIVVSASLVARVLGCEWAMVDLHRRLPLPGFAGRLNGVLPHANGLAPIALVGLLLAVGGSRKPNWPAAAASTLALLATDSRAMIGVAPVALLLLHLERRHVAKLARVGSIALGAGLLLWSLAVSGVLLDVSGSTDARGLDGRTRVWAFAISYFHSSPIFGAGGSAFDAHFRHSSGLVYAGQAHNQFFQTLAAEGILGVIALVGVAVSLASLARARYRTSAGLSGALSLAVLVYSLFESPLRVARWSPSLLVLSTLLAVLCCRQDKQGLRQPIDEISTVAVA